MLRTARAASFCCIRELGQIKRMGALLSFRNYGSSSEVDMGELLRLRNEYRIPKSSWKKEDFDSISVLSFNLLAPCYRRLSGQRNSMGRTLRESHSVDAWEIRANQTLAFLKLHVLGSQDDGGGSPTHRHSIVALQEFWLEPSYRQRFTKAFSEAGYKMHTLKRGGKKTDAVAVLYQADQFELRAAREVRLVADDRVALLLRLKHKNTGRDMIVANTHLTFPHSLFDRQLQLRQVSALCSELAKFNEEQHLRDDAVCIVTGDFNVEDKSAVCQHLRVQGFVAAFDVDRPMNKTQADGQPSATWVSHRTHLQEDVGVDHIFVRRPRCAGEDGTSSTDGVFIDGSAILPQGSPCGAWEPDFAISDHRPVRTTLHIKR